MGNPIVFYDVVYAELFYRVYRIRNQNLGQWEALELLLALLYVLVMFYIGDDTMRMTHHAIILQILKNGYSSSPAARYRILGSKNMQGFMSAMQERSSPLA